MAEVLRTALRRAEVDEVVVLCDVTVMQLENESSIKCCLRPMLKVDK